MRRLVRPLVAALLILALAGAGGAVWKRDEIARLHAVNTLFAPDRIAANFSAMETMFHSRAMDAGTPAPLPPAGRSLAEALPPELLSDWQAWLDARAVTGWVILQDGALLAEGYPHGGPADRRISWSMAKSVLALLLGQLEAEGVIALDTAASDLVPALRGGAYDGVTLHDILRMRSGVAFDEDYFAFNSDINRMGRVLALGGSMDGFAAALTERRGTPGADWQYVSIDTHVLGMAIRAATGQSIPELIAARLFRPLGLDPDPLYLTDGHGVAFVLGGLVMTTRDYARLGWLVAQGGQWQGRQIVPAEWIARATTPDPPGARYGLHWWLPPAAQGGETYARGIYGQFLWIDPARGVVIAVNAADRGFRTPGAEAGAIALFRRLSAALAPPGPRPGIDSPRRAP